MSNVPSSSRVKHGNPGESAVIRLFGIVSLPASWGARLVLFVSLSATLIGWGIARQNVYETAKINFAARSSDVSLHVQHRLHTYEYVLRGAAALFASPGSVDREVWNTYAAALKADRHLSGILGVGYAQHISANEKQALIDHVRAEGLPGYTILPAGQRSEYAPVVYLEPFASRNFRAFGYDMLSEQVRRTAMERARDTGEIAVSRKVTLMRDADKKVQYGFLMYLAVYKNGQTHNTPASRRAALVGYVFSPFRMDDMMAGIVGRSMPDLDIHIYDGENETASALMYDSFREQDRQHIPQFSRNTSISIGGHQWTVHAASLPAFEAEVDGKSPTIILLMGALISLLLFYSARVQERSRKHAAILAEEMTRAYKASELQLQAILDNSPYLAWLKDTKGRYLKVNRAYLSYVRMKDARQVVGKTDFDLWPKELAEKYRQDDAEVMAQRQQKQIEEPSFDGNEMHWAETFKTPVIDGKGRVLGTTGFARDITERRKAEEALRKLSQAMEQSHSSVIITDLKANIEYVNQAFLSETGYRSGEIIGRNPRLLNSGKNPASIYSEMWAHLICGDAWKGELINRRKDGSEYTVAVSISPVRNADGRITHYLGVRDDITERKNKEAEILRLSRAYRLLSRVNETIVRAQDRNELFKAICESAVASELFRFVWIGMLDEKRSLVIPVTYAGVEEGYTDQLDIRLDDERTGNGPVGSAIRHGFHIICQDIANDPSMAPWRDEALKRGYRASGVFPIHEEGVVVGAINIYAAEVNFFAPDIVRLMRELAADMSFALDVFAEKSRRIQAENNLRQLNLELESRVQERTHLLEVANNELEAFSYSVSHDLRAPLRSIDGFSQILSKKYNGILDDTGRDYLERVRRASQRMGHLIDDLLQLSRVTRNSLKREQIDLSALAENVLEDLRKTRSAQQVSFVLQPGLSVYADPGLLRIVMDNLLGNACKFTGKTADAKIEFGFMDCNGENAFFVRDNGAGFNMDYAHKLFGAFQRLHGASEFEGTGIGLATVQRIIHRHHGRVWAEAKEGRGATFYFTLPQRMRKK